MTIAILHAVSALILAVAVILTLVRLRAWLARDLLFLLLTLLGFMILHDMSNILEWSRWDARLDFAEDFIEILLPLMWIFLIYALLQFLTRNDLKTQIEQRQKAEQERNRVEASMLQAQKLESLGVLSSGIAHDFNNLLTTILGNAELLLLAPDKADKVIQRTRQISDASQHAADLCRQMLVFSGKAESDLRSLNINPLLKEIEALLSSSLSDKVELTYHLEPDLPEVEADAVQMRQVFMNLLINASEAMEDSPGRIRISSRVSPADADWSSIQFWIGGAPGREAMLCVEVEDQGKGMETETIQRIFDPFFTTKFTGRGLGLAAVQGIVHGHEGHLGVKSKPGQGSRFVILLPLPENHRPQGKD